MVSFGVPPTQGTNPSRAWHLARHLPTHGWEAIILTPKHPRRRLTVTRTREHRDCLIPLRQVTDPSGIPFWLQETEYHDLLLSWRKRLPRSNVDQSLPGLYGREIPEDDEIALEPPPEPRTPVQKLVFGFRCRPDARAGWIEPALQAARAVAQSLPYDSVIALRPPLSAQTIAKIIARERKIPLRIDNLLPSFDEADVARPVGAPSGPIVLVHAGPTAVHGRDPHVVLDAVRRLLDSGRVGKGGIRVRFLGARDPRLGRAIAARALGSIVTLEPEVPWVVSLQTQAEASALIVALGPGDAGRLPDRAIEGLAVHRPLLVIGLADTGVRGFLSATRAGAAYPDSQSLADAIANLPQAPLELNEEGVAPYRARNIVAKLAERL